MAEPEHDAVGLEPALRFAIPERNDGASSHRFEENGQRGRHLQLRERGRRLPFEPTELQERVAPLAAFESDCGHGYVQRSTFFEAEVEGGEVVVLRPDAVPGFATKWIDLFHRDRHAELAEGFLVALELPSPRRLVGRVPRFDAFGKVVERERTASIEQRGREVEQPLQSISHSTPPFLRQQPV